MSDEEKDLKIAEKLLLLVKHGQSILFDFSYLGRGNPVIFSQKYKKISQAMLRFYPEKPDKFKVKDYQDLIEFKATSVYDEAEPFYMAINRLRTWMTESYTVLKATSSFVEEIGVNGGNISRNFMLLLVLLGKTCFISSMFPDVKAVITFFRVSAKQLGKPVKDLNAVIEFEKTFSNPMSVVRKELEGIHMAVGRMINDFGFLWSKSEHEPKELKLNSWKELMFFGNPSHADRRGVNIDFLRFFYRELIIEGVLLGSVLCPESVAFPNNVNKMSPKQIKNLGKKPTLTISTINNILRYYIALPVCGNQNVDIQVQIAETMKYKCRKSGFQVGKFKKHIKKLDLKRMVIAHRMRKLFIMTQMKHIYHVLRDSPELLGPKLPLIISLMAVAKVEVLWTLCHLDNVKVWNPKRDTFEFKNEHIPQIMFYMDWIFRITLQHEGAVRKYFSTVVNEDEELMKVDRDELEKTLGEEGLDALDYVIMEYKGAKNLFPARLTWERIMVRCLYKKNLKEGAVKNFFIKFDELFLMSQYRDNLRPLLVDMSLKFLYFFEKYFETMFKFLVNRNLQYAMSMVRLWDIFREVAPPLNLDQRKKIGFESTIPAENLIREIVDRVLGLIHEIQGKDGIVVLFKRMKMKGKEEWFKHGEESYFRNEVYCESLYNIQEQLFRGLGELNQNQEVQIYDTVFHPLEYLKQGIAQIVEDYIDGLVKLKGQESHRQMVCPTKIVNRINVLISVLHMISQFINITPRQLVLTSMVNKFVLLDSKKSEKEKEKAQRKSVIGYLSRFYTLHICQKVREYHLLYHPIKGTFVNSEKSSKFINFKVENYMDQNELIALVTLIGPYGMENIEKRLNDLVVGITDNIRKEILDPFKKELVKFENRLYEEDIFKFLPKWTKKYPEVDKLFDYLVDMGVYMQFRRNLHSALQKSMKTYAPQIFNIVNDVQRQVNPAIRKMKGFRKVNKLSTEVGIFEEDRSLKFLLKEVAKDKSWNVLPVAFAALLTSNRWKEHTYDTEVEGWRNNAHLIIHVFHELMFNIFPEHRLKELGRRFSHAAGLTLLNMRAQGKWEKQMNNCYVFVDKLYGSCPFLHISDFEKVNPHVLTRYAYFSFFSQK